MPSYTTPVYDRTLTDVQTKTSKGLFNVADFSRVYGNEQYVNAEILTNTGDTVAFATISTPTTSQDPTTICAEINSLINNIQLMYTWAIGLGAVIAAITNLVYTAGAGNYAPNYLDVNQWEFTLDQIKLFTDPLVRRRRPRTGVSASGQGMTRSNRWRNNYS